MTRKRPRRRKEPRAEKSDFPNANSDPPKPSKSRRPKVTGWRKWAFRLAAMTLVPALFFVLVEVGLRVFEYGYPSGFFIKIDDRDSYTTNQRFGWRFFPPAIARAPQPDELPAEKPPKAYRVSVLGGSAAMGTPDPAFAFGRMLQAMLQDRYPDTYFAVINAAMTAINSHVAVPIARDCQRHQPDLFVVYMGNNEVVGPFGSGTAFQGFSPNLTVIRASVYLKSTKIGQLIGNIAGGDDVRKTWRGMKMFEDHVAADDPRMEKVYSHFRVNLADICDVAQASGARTIVCTVPSNLKDTAPFAAVHRGDLGESEASTWQGFYESGIALAEAGKHTEAVATFLEAAAIDDRHADLHFRLGHGFLAIEQFNKAREHLVLARDLDALRFRADTRINQIIRDVAGGKSDREVYLVDAQRAFQQSELTQHGIPGSELFYEHVHMNPEGNYLLAKTVFEQVAAILPDSIRGGASKSVSPPPPRRCFELVALTAWVPYRMASMISQMEAKPPFTNQLDHDKRQTLRRQHLEELRVAGTSPSALADAQRCYHAALERAGDDLELRGHFAQLLEERGEYEDAAEQWRVLLKRFPDMAQWRIELGTALKSQGKSDDAIAEFSQAMRLNPSLASSAHFNIGAVRMKQGKLENAAAQFHRALDADPDMTQAHNSLGAVLQYQGKSDDAIACFRRALELDPNRAGTHHNLGNVLAGQDALPEAAEHYRQALEIDPLHLKTYFALALVLARQGNTSEAMQQYRRAVRAAPDNADAHYRLANMLVNRGAKLEAIGEYREVLRIDPDHVRAGYNLATVLRLSGRIPEAIEQFRQVLQRQPDFLPAGDALAGILASHPDPRFRNGAEAVRIMKEVCAQMPTANPGYLNTLAAAYAEANQFEEAVSVAAKALKIARAQENQKLVAAIDYCLALYRRDRPFRDLSVGNRR